MTTSYSNFFISSERCEFRPFSCLGPEIREQCEKVDSFASDFIEVAAVAKNLRNEQGQKVDGAIGFDIQHPHTVRNSVVDDEDITDGTLYWHEGSHPHLYPDDDNDAIDDLEELCFPGEN